jgi:uncharacterized membrane protein
LPLVRTRPAVTRVAVAFAVYIVIMVALAAYRWQIWSFGADTGTFTQVALNALRGFQDTSELGSHFHVHWAPILVVLYPFAAATHSGLSIQIVQIVVIGLGVFPFFALARRYVDDGLAATLATIVLLYPPLLAVAFDEFHEIAFYPALVFALVWAIDAERWLPAALFGLLSLLVREEALLVLAVFGVVLAVAGWRSPRSGARGLLFLEPRDRRSAIAFGVALAIVGPLVFAFYFGVVAPALGGWTASHYYVYSFARGPRELLVALFTRPLEVIRAIATPGRATYLIEALAPLLFVGVRSPWMFVVVPGLAVVLLSSDPIAWRMGSHYSGLWAPWFLIATAAAIAGIDRARATRTFARRLTGWIVACCAIVLVAFDPLHPAHYLRAPYADRADARLALASIPVLASVYTHDEWYAHVAGTMPAAEHIWNEPEYAILADDFPHANTFEPFMRLEVSRGCYAIARRYRAVVVYGRTARALVQRSCRIRRGDVRPAEYRLPASRAGTPVVD